MRIQRSDGKHVWIKFSKYSEAVNKRFEGVGSHDRCDATFHELIQRNLLGSRARAGLLVEAHGDLYHEARINIQSVCFEVSGTHRD